MCIGYPLCTQRHSLVVFYSDLRRYTAIWILRRAVRIHSSRGAAAVGKRVGKNNQGKEERSNKNRRNEQWDIVLRLAAQPAPLDEFQLVPPPPLSFHSWVPINARRSTARCRGRYRNSFHTAPKKGRGLTGSPSRIRASREFHSHHDLYRSPTSCSTAASSLFPCVFFLASPPPLHTAQLVATILIDSDLT